MTYFSSLSFNIILRAIAIIMVVFNHAYIDRYFSEHQTIDSIFFGLGFGGGAVALILLSGFNFAEFILSKSSSTEIRQGIYSLAKNIFIASLSLVIFFFILLQEFSFPELLFFQNWISADRVSKFPTWYPQVILQILLSIWLLTPLLQTLKQKSALGVSAVFLVVAIAIHLYSNLLFGLEETRRVEGGMGRLPTNYLWIFVTGWVVYYTSLQKKPIIKASISLLLIGTIIICMGYNRLDFYALILSALGLIWVKSIPVPKVSKTFLCLVSQATFTIFLLHRFFFEVFERIYPLPYHYILLFIVGLFGCLSLWILKTVFFRTYKNTKIVLFKQSTTDINNTKKTNRYQKASLKLNA